MADARLITPLYALWAGDFNFAFDAGLPAVADKVCAAGVLPCLLSKRSPAPARASQAVTEFAAAIGALAQTFATQALPHDTPAQKALRTALAEFADTLAPARAHEAAQV